MYLPPSRVGGCGLANETVVCLAEWGVHAAGTRSRYDDAPHTTHHIVRIEIYVLTAQPLDQTRRKHVPQGRGAPKCSVAFCHSIIVLEIHTSPPKLLRLTYSNSS